jgi:glycosyltransferase involved in cell wall biosynthesis
VTAPADISLSVIMPTYNRSAYVRRCLRSLRACGAAGLEIIVADDGSTDDTAEVVAETDPQAVYLRLPHTGTPAPARNRGFTISRGRYVAFLDCDDEWLAAVPGRAIELLDRYPAVDVLFAEAKMGNPAEGYRSWIEMGGQAAFFDLPCQRAEPDFRILERIPFFRRMAERNPVFIGAVIMRRQAFARCRGFDPELRGAADWELWLRMASQLTFGYLDAPLAVYTRHLDNMSSDQEGMSLEFCMALRRVRARCPDLPSAERKWIKQRLRHHLFGYAYRAYERHDYALARTRFGDLIRTCGLNPRAVLYWLLCALPFGLAGGVRRLKWRLSGEATP